MTLTPQELQALRDRALADPACAAAIAARDCNTLADILSVGRTRFNDREIGYGTIIETLGLEDGNKLIEFINTNDQLKYVKPLLEQGRLRIGSPVVQVAIQSFAQNPMLLTQVNADKLCDLGKSAFPYTSVEVAAALFPEEGA